METRSVPVPVACGVQVRQGGKPEGWARGWRCGLDNLDAPSVRGRRSCGFRCPPSASGRVGALKPGLKPGCPGRGPVQPAPGDPASAGGLD